MGRYSKYSRGIWFLQESGTSKFDIEDFKGRRLLSLFFIPSFSVKSFKPTERTRLRRLPKRGSHERKVVEDILDAGLIAHVGFVHDGQPYVLPLIYGRRGGTLYLHGSA